MFARLAPLLKLSAAIVLVLLLIDAALFRSGAYARWVIKPESLPGSVVRTALAVEHYLRPGRKNILVLGDSRVGEGFSARIADAASGRNDLHFINGSVPGTRPRVWEYLLRQLDPHSSKFAVIVMMIDYDVARTDDLQNFPLDTQYTLPFLRVSDLEEFSESFATVELREHARRAIALPLQALHEDARDLLASPLRRIHDIRKVRPKWIENLETYDSRSDTLPELTVDPSSGMPVSWGEQEAQWKPRLENYFRDLRNMAPTQTQVANENYERYWIGRIAERYHANGIPVIVFAMARGPWKADLLPAPKPNPALLELRDAGLITALPGDAFVELEQPRFFYDTSHLNHAGRERFSQMLAMHVSPLVH